MMKRSFEMPAFRACFGGVLTSTGYSVKSHTAITSFFRTRVPFLLIGFLLVKRMYSL